jgi:hypothetical protein
MRMACGIGSFLFWPLVGCPHSGAGLTLAKDLQKPCGAFGRIVSPAKFLFERRLGVEARTCVGCLGNDKRIEENSQSRAIKAPRCVTGRGASLEVVIRKFCFLAVGKPV